MYIRTLLVSILAAASVLAAEIPRAKPSEVGLSQERLDRITSAL